MALFSGLFGTKAKEGKYDKQTGALIGSLQERAAGRGPSVAKEQAIVSQAKNVADTMGTIKASGGINNALKARMLSRAGERQGTEIARAASVGRSQEQIGAQNSLANVLSNASSLEAQKEQAAQGQKDKLIGGIANLGAAYATGGGSLVAKKLMNKKGGILG